MSSTCLPALSSMRQIPGIEEGKVAVPSHTFKVVLAVCGDSKTMYAAIVPNKERISQPLSEFATTVEDVERRTGLDFFASRAMKKNAASSPRDNPAQRRNCETPPETYQSTTEPSCGSYLVRYGCGSPTCAFSFSSSIVIPNPGSVSSGRCPFCTGGKGLASKSEYSLSPRS